MLAREALAAFAARFFFSAFRTSNGQSTLELSLELIGTNLGGQGTRRPFPARQIGRDSLHALRTPRLLLRQTLAIGRSYRCQVVLRQDVLYGLVAGGDGDAEGAAVEELPVQAEGEGDGGGLLEGDEGEALAELADGVADDADEVDGPGVPEVAPQLLLVHLCRGAPWVEGGGGAVGRGRRRDGRGGCRRRR